MIAWLLYIACREADQVKCESTGVCISAAQFFCNGVNDCEDMSDEPDNCSQS